MEYVKGHSGDKQNDRVDKIATNYSKGISIESNLKKRWCFHIFMLVFNRLIRIVDHKWYIY